MTEPQLFPNQPNPKEHIARNNKNDNSTRAMNIQLNDATTRLKILEERYGTLRKKFEVTEQNIVESDKSHYEEIRLLNENVLEVKRAMKDLADKVNLLTDEIQGFTNKNEFTVLKRYVEFWQPLDFVTRKEVNDFLRKKFHKK